MADIEPATYNLRDQAGYLVFSTDDVGDAVGEYDDRRQTGEQTHFDDFGITELRERLAERKRAEREADDG